MSDWTLIYSTDSSGATVAGSVLDLAGAVLAAADVQVVYSPAEGVWWSRYCASVSARGAGAARLVSASKTFAVARRFRYSLSAIAVRGAFPLTRLASLRNR